MQVNVRSDVNKLLRQHDDLRDQLLRAAATAINNTANKVRLAAIDEISARNPEYKKSSLRGYVTVRRAKYRAHSETKSGALRKNYGGITASVVAAGKAPNLIYFVPPAARNAASWRQGAGVAANVLGKTTVYTGSFIVRGRNGQAVVVSRSALAKNNAQAMRPKGGHGRWLPKWSKGLYGPAMRSLASDRRTLVAMRASAEQHWPAAWAKASSAVLLRAGRT